MDEPMKIWRAKTLNAARRVTKVLAVDAEHYVRSTMRRAFVEQQGFADALSDQALATLKGATATAAEGAARAVTESLSDAVWLSAAPAEDPNAPLTSHGPVADVLTQVTAQLSGFMAEQQVPGAPPAWRLPARFIEGENLPSLTRTFWKALAQLKEAEEDAARREQGSKAEDRAQRWDDA